MGRKNGKHRSQPVLEESVKKGLDMLLKSFRDDESSEEYSFPASLSTEERAYIHSVAPRFGMKSRSQGKGVSRRLTVTKNEAAIVKKHYVSKLYLLPHTLEKTDQLLKDFPLTSTEIQDVLPLTNNGALEAMNGQGVHADCIHSFVPVVPPPLKPNPLFEERKKLPTWLHRQEILDVIAKNQVVMITGDTGSGKTTQVPQYLLELFSEKKEPARIICTQPRRIAAISVAERVASERAEHLGGTVGYQIRLESKMSSKTALVFCTTGILLRTLMYHDNNLERVTHLLIDEVHERDRYCDFLLGVLKSRLHRFPNLRVILMSAALDINVFSNYFANCPVLHVQGKCYPVAEYFLEEALQMTDFLGHGSGMEIGVWDMNDMSTTWNVSSGSNSNQLTRCPPLNSGNSGPSGHIRNIVFDTLIQEAFLLDNTDAIKHLCTAIKYQNMPVNYWHSHTHLTPLMAVAAKGRLELVHEFLQMGADPARRAGEWTASSLARSMQHFNVADLLDRQMSDRVESLLKIYRDRHDEEQINVDLILDLLHLIEQHQDPGAVLIFLPGYEEIMTLRDKILNYDPRFASTGKHEVFTLHSSMQSGDQRRVFLRPPPGKRKIVLSTNLAETSITIDDVVYVIDTGKVKVKSYDAITGVSSLKAEWVPQASSIQRKGRAGRCREGICFHLFSRQKYESFEKYQIPEIFRVPLEELCLQSKNLAPKDLSIANFIGLVPEAPNPHVIQRAVKMLQWMDALDPWENVTDMGRLMLELPVEPRLGKMLLTSTVLHCLDPVLTIVCCLSYRDPFLLPGDPQDKKLAATRKLELAAGTLSDHMAMLRAFMLWQVARANGKEREFAYKNFLSGATMEVIFQLRGQILDQLRKSGFVRSFQELNTNATSWVAIKACILSGLYPQVARVCYKSAKLVTRQEPSVRLHMTSALLGGDRGEGGGSQKKAIAELPSPWVIYEEISRYGGLLASLRCVTLVTPVVLAIFGGHCRLAESSIKDDPTSSDSEDDDDDDDDDDELWEDVSSTDESLDDETLKELSEGLENIALAEKFCRSPLLDERNGSGARPKKKKEKQMAEFHLDDWIRLRIDSDAAHKLFALRQKWQALFARRMRDPIGPMLAGDKEVVDTLLDVLERQEEAAGLPPSPELPRVVGDIRRGRSGGYSQPSTRSDSNHQSSYNSRQTDSANRTFRNGSEGNRWRKTDNLVGAMRMPSGPPVDGQQQSGFRRDAQPSKSGNNWNRSRTGIPEVDFGGFTPAGASHQQQQHRESWRKQPSNSRDGFRVDNLQNNGRGVATGGDMSDGRQVRNGSAKQRYDDSIATKAGGNETHYPPRFVAKKQLSQVSGKTIQGQSNNRPQSHIAENHQRQNNAQHPPGSSSHLRERGVPNSTAVFHDAHDPTTKKKKTRFRKNGGNGDAVKNG